MILFGDVEVYKNTFIKLALGSRLKCISMVTVAFSIVSFIRSAIRLFLFSKKYDRIPLQSFDFVCHIELFETDRLTIVVEESERHSGRALDLRTGNCNARVHAWE